MRRVAPLPTLEPAKLDDLAASLRGWLLLFAAWLAEHLGPFGADLRRDLDHDLRKAVRHAENIIFMQAVRRVRCPPPHRAFRPPPRGFRSTASHAAGRRRIFHIAGLNRGSLLQRAERLARLLANPATAIARAVRRLRRVRHGATLKAAVPPAVNPLAHDAAVAIAAFADTS